MNEIKIKNSGADSEADITENSMKKFVGMKQTKKVNFMGEKIEINKLTVGEVKQIQEVAKNLEDDGFAVIKSIISIATPDASDLEDDDWESLPMDELTKLSNEIMKFSGVDTSGGK
jgi:hypothetical protein